MKKKSSHRRRTKVVRRSRKNLRRTFKRNNIRKSRRHTTRRYSRVQRGGVGGEASAGTSLPECVTIDDFKQFYDSAIHTVYSGRGSVGLYLSFEKKKEFDDWMKSEKTVHFSSMNTYSSTTQYPYPVSIVSNILTQILSRDKKLCEESINIIIDKIQGFDFIDKKLNSLTQRNDTSMKTP